MLIFQENYSFDIYKIKGLTGHLKQHYCLNFQQVNYLGGPFKAKKLSSYKLSTQHNIPYGLSFLYIQGIFN